MVQYSLEIYILLYFVYSIAGWIMESVGGIFKVKKFVNRGFLIGPYCPVYGTGVILITLFLSKYQDDIPVVFFLSILLCGTLEYATSYFMEKIFNARWWNYCNKKFNINGRICLETLLPFGIAGTIILCYINPILVNWFMQFSPQILKTVAYTLTAIIAVDTCVSFAIILSFKKETYKDADNTEEISGKVKEKTEDMIMKAESDVIAFSRKLKVKELKFQRKIHYTGKSVYKNLKREHINISNRLEEKRNAVNDKLQEKRNQFEDKLKNTKSSIEQKQKESIQNFNVAIDSIKESSEEFAKQIEERFKSKSILKRRLMDAFPDLKIINRKKKNKDK